MRYTLAVLLISLSLCAGPLQKDIYTAGRCDVAPAVFGTTMSYTNGYYLWRYTPEL